LTILSVRRLCKSFGGIQAINDLSFELAEGTVTALIGPNGAGKSTVFNLLSGLVRPDSGEIYFRGRAITHAAPYRIARLGVARTFQDTRLFEEMTALENVLIACNQTDENLWAAVFAAGPARQMADAQQAKARSYLDMVELSGKCAIRACELPLAERRFLEIARALALNPRLVLLDEPTAGLSSDLVSRIVRVIDQLRAGGKTTLVIEHNMKFATAVSDCVVALNFGQKIAEGPVMEVIGSEAVMEAYLGKRDVLSQSYKNL